MGTLKRRFSDLSKGVGTIWGLLRCLWRLETFSFLKFQNLIQETYQGFSCIVQYPKLTNVSHIQQVPRSP